MELVIKASANLGLTVIAVVHWGAAVADDLSLAAAAGRHGRRGFKELAKRWKPIFDYADKNGVDIAFELHPGEDLHDGGTFERLLAATGNHPRLAINYDPSHFVLQCMDYVGFIDIYGPYIKAFHVKDAEFRPSPNPASMAATGLERRPGRFRSLGDGQVDFKQVFSRLTAVGYKSWAVLEWECTYKDACRARPKARPSCSI